MSWFTRFRPYADVFVETGTFRGDGVQQALDAGFEYVYSIERDVDLAHVAAARFREQDNVRLFHGDSAEVLPIVLGMFDEPAVFYLDAHWSGWGPETPLPLLQELAAIATRPHKDVVVVDDMRLMGAKSWSGADGTDWPRAEFDFREATLEKITEICAGRTEWATDIDRLIIWRG